MEYGFRCLLGTFNGTSVSEKLGLLTLVYASSGFASSYTKQTEARQAEIELLGRLAARLVEAIPQSREWSLLLEYEIPRRGNRPDAIVLAEDLIFVIEFKVGATGFSGDAEWQVISYALDLRDFHPASQSRTILPVVATAASHEDSPLLLDTLATANCARPSPEDSRERRRRPCSVHRKLLSRTFHKHDARPIDAKDWAGRPIGPALGSSRPPNSSLPATRWTTFPTPSRII